MSSSISDSHSKSPRSPFLRGDFPANMIRPDIIDMEPYTPIVPFEVLSRQLGRRPEEIIKLDANENPYGPAPAALEALKNGRFFHIYPDPEATELREALGGYLQLNPEMLLAGMGADELIDLVLRVVLKPQDKVIDSPPSFGMYPFSTYVNSGQYLTVPRRPDFSMDIDAIEALVHGDPSVKIVFVCSPNNPDGSVIQEESLKRLLDLPVLVVLDEAYVEFAALTGTPSRISWVAERENLCVLRTFSKLAGLAGLRVGYGAFPDWLLPHLKKIKQPYNVNVAADLAARGALSDPAWLERTAAALAAERDRMMAALAQIPYLTPLPSQSNFVLCRVQDRSAGDLKLKLQNEFGILVRFYEKPNLKNYIRISAGKPEDTDRLMMALGKI